MATNNKNINYPYIPKDRTIKYTSADNNYMKEAKKYAAQFPAVKLFKLSDVAGDWTKAQKTHFADGGLFDQIYQPK